MTIPPLPLRLLSVAYADGELIPRWLCDDDRPWLRELLLDAEAFAGRPLAELLRRWRHGDPDPRAGAGLAAARHVLRHWLVPKPADDGAMRRRHELFAAAASGAARERALATVAAQYGLSAATLHDELFEDLPHARRVRWPQPAPPVSRLLLATNTAMAQALLRTAESAELQLLGGSRAVLRSAWLLGARFLGHAAAPADAGVQLQWYRAPHDRTAGRALAALVPLLPWTRHFTLRASCRGPAGAGAFVLSSVDQLLPGPEPRAFDSALERRFAGDFAVAAPDWELVREPAPLRHGDQLAFPDFLVKRRGDDVGCWLEIVGGRDPAALPDKLAWLQREPRYVLCVEARLAPPRHPRLVVFARRVLADAVLRTLAATIANWPAITAGGSARAAD